jgi:hypothetical protein
MKCGNINNGEEAASIEEMKLFSGNQKPKKIFNSNLKTMARRSKIIEK